ncbi:MAG: hypothetical protein Q9P01_15520 [Anaerolineae bacterium]|nr:hypothetical protein [Anaerolineae bacterium]MDQ7036185.1 hypothetical protein [Anaerolineae bacterium]
MDYIEYMIMSAYKSEAKLLDKKINEHHQRNREDENERPKRSRPRRFWWHFEHGKSEQTR